MKTLLSIVIAAWLICSASPGSCASELHGLYFENKTTVKYEAGYQVMAVRSTAEPRQADFALWLPDGIKRLRGMVVISRHGSGESLYRDSQLRRLGAKLQLALVGLIGDGVQRGVAPGVLEDALAKLAEQSRHPEIVEAPVITFGMSNGTGFSCGYACMRPERVIGWIAFHPGSDLLFSRQFDHEQLQQAVVHDPANKWLQINPPPMYSIPGLVVVGEIDELAGLAKGTPEKPDGNTELAFENARREHDALMQFIVEPGVGHGHNGSKSWTIVREFIETIAELRIPRKQDAGQMPAAKPINRTNGWLGKTWDKKVGGGQQLEVVAGSSFTGDRGKTSWLPTRSYARKWQEFSREESLMSAR
jgi:hypothetical protein